jgi:hypothetical protein
MKPVARNGSPSFQGSDTLDIEGMSVDVDWMAFFPFLAMWEPIFIFTIHCVQSLQGVLPKSSLQGSVK